jgi:hypothetical protein
MKLARLFLAIGSLALLGPALTSPARADSFDKKTTLTIKDTIQVPNAVLQPGKYVFKLLNSNSSRHIVQIYNADQTQLITTILAIPDYRIKVTGKTQFLFWETPPGQPKALRAWFYPGDNFGQEFAYPKSEATELAAVAKTDVPSTETKAAPELKAAEVVEVTPQGNTEPVPAPPKRVQVAKAAPPPEPAPEPAPSAAPPAQLPATASPYPLIGLAGLLFLAGFGVVRVIRAS